MKKIQDISPGQWEVLARQKIYFGHQSVGENIIDGIRAVMDQYPEIKLKIAETREMPSDGTGIFAHSKIGRNEDPSSKTEDFAEVVDSWLGERADIAFHKYCYIDVNATTDVEKVFSVYRDRINSLKAKYPGTRFVHVTMPLTTVQSGPKVWIKKIIGKPAAGVEANVKRNQFNMLLIENYQGRDPIFDLARIEAVRPDGTVTTFGRGRTEYLSMYKGYSSDGGHLNKMGQLVVAEQLLIFLAEFTGE